MRNGQEYFTYSNGEIGNCESYTVPRGCTYSYLKNGERFYCSYETGCKAVALSKK